VEVLAGCNKDSACADESNESGDITVRIARVRNSGLRSLCGVLHVLQLGLSLRLRLGSLLRRLLLEKR
jgi:hypothetical protein